eukprot:2263467-Pleurochrysis_carterae.AAC.2
MRRGRGSEGKSVLFGLRPRRAVCPWKSTLIGSTKVEECLARSCKSTARYRTTRGKANGP